MFARNVSLRLKISSSVQFVHLFENEVVPTARRDHPGLWERKVVARVLERNAFEN